MKSLSGPILIGFSEEKNPNPPVRNPYSGVGTGKGGGVVEDKKWNVPWKRKRCLTNLELLLAEAVLEDVLGLGREKPVAEPPLRNELVEVADPCTPTVPDVDVSSSKPSTKLYSRCSFSIEKDSVVVLIMSAAIMSLANCRCSSQFIRPSCKMI